MGATSLAFKVYLILGVELAVLYGCTFFIIQQCKKAFYANKTLTTGEGGAFFTNDIDIYEYIKSIYSHGMTKQRYIHNNLVI